MNTDDSESDYLSKIEPVYITDVEWREIQRHRDPKLTDAFRQDLDERIDTFKDLQYLQRDSRGKAISSDGKRKALRDPALKLLAAIKRMDWDTRGEIFGASQIVVFPLEQNPCVPVPGDVYELLERLETSLASLLEVIKVADKQSEKWKIKKKPGTNPDRFVRLALGWNDHLRSFDVGEASRKNVGVIAKVAVRITRKKITSGTIDRAMKAIRQANKQFSQSPNPKMRERPDPV